ncbi:uncharacterized protein LOC106868339 isoform X3 [Octopus bimaculoides]|uniref:uncharacterized protein LOC106868339 isoform X3 n=1 Tax=Octopus bimaculoides TaxID=37653 RepID=UPI0022E1EB62|nr:uncharacterized protein LOC106868339 isoform X3 [Octopus bimaculoides]
MDPEGEKNPERPKSIFHLLRNSFKKSFSSPSKPKKVEGIETHEDPNIKENDAVKNGVLRKETSQDNSTTASSASKSLKKYLPETSLDLNLDSNLNGGLETPQEYIASLRSAESQKEGVEELEAEEKEEKEKDVVIEDIVKDVRTEEQEKDVITKGKEKDVLTEGIEKDVKTEENEKEKEKDIQKFEERENYVREEKGVTLEEIEKDAVKTEEIEKDAAKTEEKEKDIERIEERERDIVVSEEIQKDAAKTEEIEKGIERIEERERDIVVSEEIQKDAAKIEEIQKDIERIEERERDIVVSEEIQKDAAKIEEIESDTAKTEEKDVEKIEERERDVVSEEVEKDAAKTEEKEKDVERIGESEREVVSEEIEKEVVTTEESRKDVIFEENGKVVKGIEKEGEKAAIITGKEKEKIIEEDEKEQKIETEESINNHASSDDENAFVRNGNSQREKDLIGAYTEKNDEQECDVSGTAEKPLSLLNHIQSSSTMAENKEVPHVTSDQLCEKPDLTTIDMYSSEESSSHAGKHESTLLSNEDKVLPDKKDNVSSQSFPSATSLPSNSSYAEEKLLDKEKEEPKPEGNNSSDPLSSEAKLDSKNDNTDNTENKKDIPDIVAPNIIRQPEFSKWGAFLPKPYSKPLQQPFKKFSQLFLGKPKSTAKLSSESLPQLQSTNSTTTNSTIPPTLRTDSSLPLLPSQIAKSSPRHAHQQLQSQEPTSTPLYTQHTLSSSSIPQSISSVELSPSLSAAPSPPQTEIITTASSLTLDTIQPDVLKKETSVTLHEVPSVTPDKKLPEVPSITLSEKLPEVPSVTLDEKLPEVPSVTLTEKLPEVPSVTLDEKLPEVPSVTLDEKLPEVLLVTLNEKLPEVPSITLSEKLHEVPSVTLDEKLPEVPSVTLSEKLPEIPSVTLDEKLPEVPSMTLDEKLPEVPSITLSEKLHEVPSVTLDEKLPEVPSVTLSEKLPEVPSVTLSEKLPEVPSVTLDEKLSEVPSVTLDEKLPEVLSVTLDEKLPEVPSVTLSEKLPEVPSVTLSEKLPEIPSVTLDEKLPEVPSVTLDEKLPEVLSVTLDEKLPEVPSVTLSQKLPEIPSVTLDEKLPEVPSVTLDEKLPEVPSVTLDEKLPEVPSVTLSEKLPEVPSVTLDEKLPEVPSATLDDKLPKVSSVTLEDKLPDVAAVTTGDKLPDVSAVTLGDKLPEVSSVSLSEKLPDVPSMTLGDKLPDVPSVTLGDKLPEVPSVTLDEKLREVPSVTLDEELHDIQSPTFGDELSDVPYVTLGDKLSEVPVVTLGDKLPELQSVTLGDKPPEVPSVTLGDKLPEVPSVILDEKLPEVASVTLDEKMLEVPSTPLENKQTEAPQSYSQSEVQAKELTVLQSNALLEPISLNPVEELSVRPTVAVSEPQSPKLCEVPPLVPALELSLAPSVTQSVESFLDSSMVVSAESPMTLSEVSSLNSSATLPLSQSPSTQTLHSSPPTPPETMSPMQPERETPLLTQSSTSPTTSHFFSSSPSTQSTETSSSPTSSHTTLSSHSRAMPPTASVEGDSSSVNGNFTIIYQDANHVVQHLSDDMYKTMKQSIKRGRVKELQKIFSTCIYDKDDLHQNKAHSINGGEISDTSWVHTIGTKPIGYRPVESNLNQIFRVQNKQNEVQREEKELKTGEEKKELLNDELQQKQQTEITENTFINVDVASVPLYSTSDNAMQSGDTIYKTEPNILTNISDTSFNTSEAEEVGLVSERLINVKQQQTEESLLLPSTGFQTTITSDIMFPEQQCRLESMSKINDNIRNESDENSSYEIINTITNNDNRNIDIKNNNNNDLYSNNNDIKGVIETKTDNYVRGEDMTEEVLVVEVNRKVETINDSNVVNDQNSSQINNIHDDDDDDDDNNNNSITLGKFSTVEGKTESQLYSRNISESPVTDQEYSNGIRTSGNEEFIVKDIPSEISGESEIVEQQIENQITDKIDANRELEVEAELGNELSEKSVKPIRKEETESSGREDAEIRKKNLAQRPEKVHNKPNIQELSIFDVSKTVRKHKVRKLAKIWPPTRYMDDETETYVNFQPWKKENDMYSEKENHNIGGNAGDDETILLNGTQTHILEDNATVNEKHRPTAQERLRIVNKHIGERAVDVTSAKGFLPSPDSKVVHETVEVSPPTDIQETLPSVNKEIVYETIENSPLTVAQETSALQDGEMHETVEVSPSTDLTNFAEISSVKEAETLPAMKSETILKTCDEPLFKKTEESITFVKKEDADDVKEITSATKDEENFVPDKSVADVLSLNDSEITGEIIKTEQSRRPSVQERLRIVNSRITQIRNKNIPAQQTEEIILKTNEIAPDTKVQENTDSVTSNTAQSFYALTPLIQPQEFSTLNTEVAHKYVEVIPPLNTQESILSVSKEVIQDSVEVILPNVTQEALPSVDSEVVHEVVEVSLPTVTHEDVSSVDSVVVHEVVEVSVPTVAQEAVHSVDSEVIHEVVEVYLPTVKQEALPSVENEVVHEVVEVSLPTVTQEAVPSVESEVVHEVVEVSLPTVTQEIVPPVDSEVVHEAVEVSLPTVTQEDVSSVDSVVVHEVVEVSVPTVAQEAVHSVDSEVIHEVVEVYLPTVKQEALPSVENEVVGETVVVSLSTVTQETLPSLDDVVGEDLEVTPISYEVAPSSETKENIQVISEMNPPVDISSDFEVQPVVIPGNDEVVIEKEEGLQASSAMNTEQAERMNVEEDTISLTESLPLDVPDMIPNKFESVMAYVLHRENNEGSNEIISDHTELPECYKQGSFLSMSNEEKQIPKANQPPIASAVESDPPEANRKTDDLNDVRDEIEIFYSVKTEDINEVKGEMETGTGMAVTSGETLEEINANENTSGKIDLIVGEIERDIDHEERKEQEKDEKESEEVVVIGSTEVVVVAGEREEEREEESLEKEESQIEKVEVEEVMVMSEEKHKEDEKDKEIVISENILIDNENTLSSVSALEVNKVGEREKHLLTKKGVSKSNNTFFRSSPSFVQSCASVDTNEKGVIKDIATDITPITTTITTTTTTIIETSTTDLTQKVLKKSDETGVVVGEEITLVEAEYNIVPTIASEIHSTPTSVENIQTVVVSGTYLGDSVGNKEEEGEEKKEDDKEEEEGRTVEGEETHLKEDNSGSNLDRVSYIPYYSTNSEMLTRLKQPPEGNQTPLIRSDSTATAAAKTITKSNGTISTYPAVTNTVITESSTSVSPEHDTGTGERLVYGLSSVEKTQGENVRENESVVLAASKESESNRDFNGEQNAKYPGSATVSRSSSSCSSLGSNFLGEFASQEYSEENVKVEPTVIKSTNETEKEQVVTGKPVNFLRRIFESGRSIFGETKKTSDKSTAEPVEYLTNGTVHPRHLQDSNGLLREHETIDANKNNDQITRWTTPITANEPLASQPNKPADAASLTGYNDARPGTVVEANLTGSEVVNHDVSGDRSRVENLNALSSFEKTSPDSVDVQHQTQRSHREIKEIRSSEYPEEEWASHLQHKSEADYFIVKNPLVKNGTEYVAPEIQQTSNQMVAASPVKKDFETAEDVHAHINTPVETLPSSEINRNENNDLWTVESPSEINKRIRADGVIDYNIMQPLKNKLISDETLESQPNILAQTAQNTFSENSIITQQPTQAVISNTETGLTTSENYKTPSSRNVEISSPAIVESFVTSEQRQSFLLSPTLNDGENDIEDGSIAINEQKREALIKGNVHRRIKAFEVPKDTVMNVNSKPVKLRSRPSLYNSSGEGSTEFLYEKVKSELRPIPAKEVVDTKMESNFIEEHTEVSEPAYISKLDNGLETTITPSPIIYRETSKEIENHIEDRPDDNDSNHQYKVVSLTPSTGEHNQIKHVIYCEINRTKMENNTNDTHSSESGDELSDNENHQMKKQKRINHQFMPNVNKPEATILQTSSNHVLHSQMKPPEPTVVKKNHSENFVDSGMGTETVSSEGETEIVETSTEYRFLPQVNYQKAILIPSQTTNVPPKQTITMEYVQKNSSTPALARPTTLVNNSSSIEAHKIYELNTEPESVSTSDAEEDLRIVRGKLLIKNVIDSPKDGDDFDDNINVFADGFHLDKENPLYQSDPDLSKREESEEESELQEWTDDITFETIDEIAKTHSVMKKDSQSKQKLTKTLLTRLSNIDSKDIKQNINVEHKHEEIHGDIDFIHADGSRITSNFTDNFDSIAENVELWVQSGKAVIMIKVIAERIIPIDYEFNVWRKSSAIVTRQIELDLQANEQRQRLYAHVMKKHGKYGSGYQLKGSYEDDTYIQDREKVLNSRDTFKLFNQLLDVAEDSKEDGDQEERYIEKTERNALQRPNTNDFMY